MKRLLGLLLVVLIATAARASTVDFNNYSPMYVWQPVVAYQGLTFSAGAGNICGATACQYVWSGSPNDNGTPALIYAFGTPTTITKTGGGAFDLNGFDMTLSWYDGLASDSVTLVANLLGGGQTTETLNLIQGLQTYDLNLANVISVDISNVTSNSGYWLMDNVVYNGSAVPEPGSLLLLGTGIAGLAAAIRRKLTA